MTPQEFLAKWRHVELKERSASQSHFNDLCALLGVLDPISADPAGEWFTFEKGASKTSGGDGWADVWRKECFGWEYKGRHANLDKAFAQLLQYSVALENPPLLIVSDMDRIRIHTNWTNTVQEVHEFALDDLLDSAVRERLKKAFTDPEEFRPQKTRQALTEETVYGEDGQLLTASFMDYAMPRAGTVPSFHFETRNVPSTTNALGMKGAGEAGTIGATPATLNAVVDALHRAYGIGHVDMPATPLRIWTAIQEAFVT